jgi:hypothetical protein
LRIKISDDNVMMQSFILSQELIKVKNLKGSVTAKMLRIHGQMGHSIQRNNIRQSPGPRVIWMIKTKQKRFFLKLITILFANIF